MSITAKTNEAVENIIAIADDTSGKEENDLFGGPAGLMEQLSWAIKAKDTVAPYWSRKRDEDLRKFWKQEGATHISAAMYNAQTKLLSIPSRIVARDPSIVSHVRQAQEYNNRLNTLSEYGSGFYSALERFYEDFLSQDNGGFLEIIGAGNKAGLIEGPALAVRHLDAGRCVRTSDPIYPVKYTDDDGNQYALHYSRVIYKAQMASPDADLRGVGFCAVSRAIAAAQSLIDIMIYKQEKLGSRPMSKMFLGKGVRAEDIMRALRAGDLQMDKENLRRYSKNIAIGSESTDVDIKVIDLTSMDQFKEDVAVPYAMFAIAVAFGMDPNELWPGAAGASSAAASVALLRARNHLPSQVMSILENEFNFKFLPPHLQMVFDYQDDEEDQQQAVIRDIRARNRERNLYSRVTTVLTERRQMKADGDITEDLFNSMELSDGRLPDGSSVESLFYVDDDFFTGPEGLLNLGMPEPTVVIGADHDAQLEAIDKAMSRCYRAYATESAPRMRLRVDMAVAALDSLTARIKQQMMIENAARLNEEVTSVSVEEGMPMDEEETDTTQQQDEGDMGPRFRQRTSSRTSRIQRDDDLIGDSRYQQLILEAVLD